MAIVNASIMAEIAVDFNIGADLLGKGNREVEKHLGAENMSGDTVQVPIMDSGTVHRTMDLTGIDLSVNRDTVPVTVGPYTTAAAVTQEDLTLSIKNPEIMTKRVANLADEANLDAFKCLRNGSRAFVASDKTSDVIRAIMFDAEAHTVGSKMGGETFGVTHPQTYNRIVGSLQANFGTGAQGKDLYRNELGDFMGFAWSKGSDMNTIVAAAQLFGNVTLTNGSADFTYSGAATTPAAGTVSQPFTVAGVFCVDALGKKTGDLASFYAEYDGTDWALTGPAFFTGPRQNVWTATINTPVNPAIVPTTVVGASADQLAAGTTYLAPAVLWKKNDFLVAVKGVEKFMGLDSYTIPTAFKDRGILPLRGTCWTEGRASQSVFRVDVLAGFALYQRVSVSSIYIPA